MAHVYYYALLLEQRVGTEPTTEGWKPTIFPVKLALHICFWLRRWDSNPRPSAYEADEIKPTSPRRNILLVLRVGLEPTRTMATTFKAVVTTNSTTGALYHNLVHRMGFDPICAG